MGFRYSSQEKKKKNLTILVCGLISQKLYRHFLVDKNTESEKGSGWHNQVPEAESLLSVLVQLVGHHMDPADETRREDCTMPLLAGVGR